jgi:uncharacterized Zn finger protein
MSATAIPFGEKAAALKEKAKAKKKPLRKKTAASKKAASVAKKATAEAASTRGRKSPATKAKSTKKSAAKKPPVRTAKKPASVLKKNPAIPQDSELDVLKLPVEHAWDEDRDEDWDEDWADDDESDWDDDDDDEEEESDWDDDDADEEEDESRFSRRGYSGGDSWWHYEPAPPIAVRGGIRAKSTRGAFATKWWGKRWIDTLESFHIGARLTRGKSYARKGQVSSLQIGGGSVRALVQGTMRTPYKVTIKLRAFSPEEWTKILRKLRAEPIHTVRLLNGEMPEDFEALVLQTGVPLFPGRHADLATDCSCPDYSNPCKHIAAVYYILAEALDDDPFLLLRLRGMDREQMMNMLKGPTSATSAPAEAPAPAPLPLSSAEFWSWKSDVPAGTQQSVLPNVHAALPRRLGAIPFWRSATPFLETMEQLYATASRDAMDWLPEEGGSPE